MTKKVHFTAILVGLLSAIVPAFGADLSESYFEPVPSNKWQFSFTPYGWALNINGTATVGGHKVDVDKSFIDLIEESDSILAWMSYFEARNGRFAFFTDLVWAELTFSAHRDVSRNPFSRFPNVNLAISANAEADYQSTIIQSGIAYEIAKWQREPGAYTAFDVLGSARYWNQELDLSLRASGTLTADLERFGLKLQRARNVALARTGELEWVDPVVGARIRHHFASGADLNLTGDIGGFGAGSDFSWQVVATYSFDVRCLGTPLRAVVGYRALAVDYSENGLFGRNGLDVIEHGPVMGVRFHW